MLFCLNSKPQSEPLLNFQKPPLKIAGNWSLDSQIQGQEPYQLSYPSQLRGNPNWTRETPSLLVERQLSSCPGSALIWFWKSHVYPDKRRSRSPEEKKPSTKSKHASTGTESSPVWNVQGWLVLGTVCVESACFLAAQTQYKMSENLSLYQERDRRTRRHSRIIFACSASRVM